MVDGDDLALGSDEVIITETPRDGWTVATEAGVSGGTGPAHHTAVAPRWSGRDVIRLIQQACKAVGLEVSDRVQVHFEAASDEVRARSVNTATSWPRRYWRRASIPACRRGRNWRTGAPARVSPSSSAERRRRHSRPWPPVGYTNRQIEDDGLGCAVHCSRDHCCARRSPVARPTIV
jgi:hypothetical protein